MKARLRLNRPMGFHRLRRLHQRQGGPIDSIEPDTVIALWTLLLEPRLREALMRAPRRFQCSDGTPVIEVLGTFRVAMSSAPLPVLLSVSHGAAGWKPASGRQFDLAPALVGAGWVRSWLGVVAPPLDRALTGEGAMCLEPTEALLTRDAVALALWERFRDSPELRYQRDAVRRSLPLDPRAVRLAWRRRNRLELDAYSAARTAEWWRQRRAAPRSAVLGILERLIHAGALSRCSNAGTLQAVLRERGVPDGAIRWFSETGWRGVRGHCPEAAFREDPLGALATAVCLAWSVAGEACGRPAEAVESSEA